MNDLSVVSLAVSILVGIATVAQRFFFDPRDARLKDIEEDVAKLRDHANRVAVDIARCETQHASVSDRSDEMNGRIATLDRKFDQIRETLAKIEGSIAVLVERSMKQ